MDIMTKMKLATTFVLATTVTATPALTQSGEKQNTEKPRIHIVEHDDVIGPSVTNGREGDGLEMLGTVSNLVLDGRSGSIRYAIIASRGGKQTATAWDTLAWDRKSSQFTMSMTAAALEKLPKFDRKNLQRMDGTVDVGGKATSGSAVRVTDGAARDERPSYVLATEISDCAVVADKEQVGSGAKLFIEPESGHAAFLSVASGGVIGIGETSYVLPWAALRLVKPVGEKDLQIRIDKGRDALETAPKLGDEGADLNESEFRQKVYEFYGVERPAFEPAKRKAKDDRR